MPTLFTGIKVAAALAATAAVVAEFVSSDRGLGYLLVDYTNRFDTPGVFAAILVLSLMGLLLYGAVELVERHGDPVARLTPRGRRACPVRNLTTRTNRRNPMAIKTTLAALGAAALVALAALSPAPASAADPVTFRLNWIMYGFHTPFYLGVERGYYADEGIDLTIGEGQGSVRAVQTVGAKGDMFGLADGGSVTAGVARGAPVKAVMAVTSSSPYALSVRKDSGITTLKEVEGHTIASAPGEAGLQLLPALFARNGVDIDKVRILRVDGAGKMVAVLEGRAEGLMAGLDNQSLTLPARGRAADRFRLRRPRHQHDGPPDLHPHRPDRGKPRPRPPLRRGDGEEFPGRDRRSRRPRSPRASQSSPTSTRIWRSSSSRPASR